MNQILILFAHPSFEKSVVMKGLIKAASGMKNVYIRDLYETYPDFLISAEDEQRLLVESDVIIFQHPFFWYSMPSLLKEWMDIVLSSGFAFGPGGDALSGKTMMSVISTGGKESSFASEGPLSIKGLLAPIAKSASLCKMNYLSPFVVHGANEIKRTHDNKKLNKETENYRLLLSALVENNLNLEAAARVPRLNADIKSILKN